MSTRTSLATAHAEWYWCEPDDERILGRCVRLALDPFTRRHYHWGIRPGPDGQPEVEEFWDSERWTTQRYREARGNTRWK